MPAYNFNDKVSSVICGSKVRAVFCDDAVNTSNDCLNGRGISQAGWISNPRIGKNDGISSVYIFPYNELANPAVTLFENADCTGSSAAFLAEGSGSVKSFNMSSLQQGNMGNDKVSSVMVPFNIVLTLYQDDDFLGSSF